MLERSSIELTSLRLEYSGSAKLLLLTLNVVPLLHLLSVVGALLLPGSWTLRILAAVAALYVAPALVARLILKTAPIAEGKITLGSKSFFAWWAVLQLQNLFNRVPALDELLRLVPGLYSQWLRLWGARIGRLTYWAPGTLILDRSFLHVGDDVVFGAGARLNAHVIQPDEQGTKVLLLATIHIGDRATIGGYSLLTAGTVVASNDATRAFTISPPFSRWQNGKRVRDLQG